MILACSDENKKLVSEMEKIINGTDGYHALIDWDWSNGAEIRLEINAVDVLRCPYIVSSWIGNGRVCVKDRVLSIAYNGKHIDGWKTWRARLDGLVEKLNQCVERNSPGTEE